jgi:hypothetical protein
MSSATRAVGDDLPQPRFRNATAALTRAAADADASPVIYASVALANSVCSRAASTTDRTIFVLPHAAGYAGHRPIVGVPDSL